MRRETSLLRLPDAAGPSGDSWSEAAGGAPPCRAPWARAGVLAGSSIVLAAVAHVVAGGHSVPPLLLAGLLLAVTVVLRLGLDREARAGALLAAVSSLQVGLHLVFTQVTAQPGPAMHDMAMDHAASAGSPPPAIWMLVAHGVAVLLVVALLRDGERSFCSAARVCRAAWMWLSPAVLLRLTAALLTIEPGLRISRPAKWDRPRPWPREVLLPGTISRRGPPARLA